MSKLKSSLRVVILSLAALMAIATSCKKEPSPDAAAPKQTPAMAPNDTLPRVPMDPGPAATMWTAPREDFITKTLGIDWGRQGLFDWDSVQYVANLHYCDSVMLKIIQNEYEMIPGCFTPDVFLTVRAIITECMDSLTARGKTPRGQGTIWVARDSLPNIYVPPFSMGIALAEQEYFTNLGFIVAVFDPYRETLSWNAAQHFGTNNCRPSKPEQVYDEIFPETGDIPRKKKY